jgi:hypothetical protein
MSEHQPKVREYDKVKYSDKDMWWANSKVAIAVFAIALIYARFLSVETTQVAISEQQQAMTEQMGTAIELLRENDISNVEYLNDRMDKKTKRIEDDLEKTKIDSKIDKEKIWAEIEKLKLPNTDKD